MSIEQFIIYFCYEILPLYLSTSLTWKTKKFFQIVEQFGRGLLNEHEFFCCDTRLHFHLSFWILPAIQLKSTWISIKLMSLGLDQLILSFYKFEVQLTILSRCRDFFLCFRWCLFSSPFSSTPFSPFLSLCFDFEDVPFSWPFVLAVEEDYWKRE